MLKSLCEQAEETIIFLSEKETSNLLLPVAIVSGTLFVFGR